jgi:hypothetical protein
MTRTISGPFATTGREASVAEAVRTPIGRSHPGTATLAQRVG